MKLKAIIFVKDRIVAEYLKRILISYYDREAEESKINDSKTKQKFRFGLAIGF